MAKIINFPNKIKIQTQSGELSIGTRIYYTGDMANHEAFGTITKIEPCKFYQWSITIEYDKEDDKANSVLSPMNFSQGPGRRFMTEEQLNSERQAKIEAFNLRYRKGIKND